jgi:hypothetical protein
MPAAERYQGSRAAEAGGNAKNVATLPARVDRRALDGVVCRKLFVE